ncbi:MAG: sigma-54 interaction domain-containing protein, partial [Nitrospinales bacterium]
MARNYSKNLSNALNVLNEAVFIYDQNMEIQFFNEAAEKITGFGKEDVLGKKCTTLFKQSVCLNNCGLCLSVKNGGENANFKSHFIRKDGFERMGRFRSGLLTQRKNGEVEVLVALTDITKINQLKKELSQVHSFQNIIGKSRPMRELFKTIKNIAEFDSTVLIEGENGTGKELVAKAIHYESPRAEHNRVTVHCSSFSDNLLESELFGHVKGAFTGAVKDRVGRFEEADGGTIFLDEVSDLNMSIQTKLLRVIQEKEIERVGENKTRKVDIRIIAASNKDLLKEVEAGRFREDLYYRLNVIPIHLPPLRERKEDIPPLAQHFISRWKGMDRKKVHRLSNSALCKLMDHYWPGNVRELENLIEHACVKCTGEIIQPKDLPGSLGRTGDFHIQRKKPRRKLSPQ